MKRILLIFAVFTISLGLCSCALPDTPQTAETVDDVFSLPTEDQAPLETEPVRVSMSGISSYGYLDGAEDDAGVYYLYEGGEMSIPLRLSVMGLEEEGVGLVLFLDGQPQAYHTDFDKTDRYMHTVYPDDLVADRVELRFIPRTGTVGDVKTIDFLMVPFPGQESRDGGTPARFIGLKRGIVSRLVYEADPPEPQAVPVTECVLHWSAQYRDLTSDEIALWSSENYQTMVEAEFSAEDMVAYGTRTGFDGETVNFRLVLKGAPDAEYALTVFVNDQPVTVSPEQIIRTTTENGQKLVVDMVLDVSDLTDHFSVYAMLSPTVYRNEGWDDNFISGYFFFERKE